MPEYVVLGWNETRAYAEQLATQILKDRFGMSGTRVFPIPRGGIPAALLVQQFWQFCQSTMQIVGTPNEAEIFIDDLIDSGKTRDQVQYRHGQRPFYALIDKKQEGFEGKWIVFPWETMQNESGPEDAVTRILQYIGEDPDREGLKETPKRVVKSYGELFSGYKVDPASVFKTFEDGACDQMVILKDIEFYSACEHHMLPFFGKAHIAYIPRGKVIGVSKLARLLEVFSRRLQIQERLGQEVTKALDAHLNPVGSACILEAQHFCMVCRGINKQNSKMVTSSVTGAFRDNLAAREELLRLIK